MDARRSSLLWQLGAAREPLIALVWERLLPADLWRLRRVSRACADETAEAARRMRDQWNPRVAGCWAPVSVREQTFRAALAAVERSDADGAHCCACLWASFGGWSGLCWSLDERGGLLRAVSRLGRAATARCIRRCDDTCAGNALYWLRGPGRGNEGWACDFGCLARLMGWQLLDRDMSVVLSNVLCGYESEADEHAVLDVLRGLRPDRDDVRHEAELTMHYNTELADVLDDYAHQTWGLDTGAWGEVTPDAVFDAIVQSGGSTAMAARAVWRLGRS